MENAFYNFKNFLVFFVYLHFFVKIIHQYTQVCPPQPVFIVWIQLLVRDCNKSSLGSGFKSYFSKTWDTVWTDENIQDTLGCIDADF